MRSIPIPDGRIRPRYKPRTMTATVDADMRLLLEWVFENALDEDKSGFIERAAEANRVAKYCGYGGRTPRLTALWTSMLREMDTDGDGGSRRRNTSSS